MSDLETKVINMGAVEGVNVLGSMYYFLSSADSEFVFNFTMPAGAMVPPHIHPAQDEFLYIIDGQLDYIIEGEVHTANEGDLAVLPRGVAHGINNNTASETKALGWVSPAGGLQNFFEKVTHVSPDDIPTVVQLAAENGINILPPPE